MFFRKILAPYCKTQKYNLSEKCRDIFIKPVGTHTNAKASKS